MSHPSFKVGDDVRLIERRPLPARQRVQKFDPARQRWRHTFVTVTRQIVTETAGWTVTHLDERSACIHGQRLANGAHVSVNRTVPLEDLRPARGAER